MQAGALASWRGAPVAMAIGAVVAGAVIVAIRLARPETFLPGYPKRTSKKAASASADASQRSERT